MDELDRSLLRLLAADARLPYAELGRRIGLSRTATLARVRRLEEAGVIRGYRADIARPQAQRQHVSRVGIAVRTPDVAGYVRRLARFPELEEAEAVAGEFDLLCRFATDTAERLDEILDRIGGWRETVRTTTWMVLKAYGLPARSDAARGAGGCGR